jgi:hypothetical protein
MKIGSKQNSVMFLLSILIILVPVLSPQNESFFQDLSSRDTIQTIERRYTEGQWDVKPLVLKGTSAPGTERRFNEFGAGYWMDSGILVFCGQFGSSDNTIGLFNLKDGKITRVFSNNVTFSEPDSVKKQARVRIVDNWGDFHRTRIYGGKRMIYADIWKEDKSRSYYVGDDCRSVYGWNGEHLVRVLGKGDKISLFGNACVVENAVVARIGEDGNALIRFETSMPEKVCWMAVHDGTTLMPLWESGVPMPNKEDAAIKYIWQVYIFPEATLSLMGATEETWGLYRINSVKNERIIGMGDKDPSNPINEIGMGPLIKLGLGLSPSGPETFVIMISFGPMASFQRWLLYDRGRWCPLVNNISDLRASEGYNDFSISPIFPHPKKSSVLFAINITDNRIGWGKDFKNMPDITDLYLFEDCRLIPIPWETTGGKVSPRINIDPTRKIEPIRIRNLPGNLEGAIVDLPFYIKNEKIKEKSDLDWIYLLESTPEEIRLITMPEFKNSTDKIIRLNNVIAWKSANEAVVRLEDGFYLITKK